MRELSLNILDIAQNCIAADASEINITVKQCTKEKTLLIEISDNGKGMSEQTLTQVCDPFYTTRTTRKVGMGISLFKLAAQQTGGDLSIESTLGKGTKIEALFHTDSIDFTPLGDVNATIVTLITMNTHIDFLYHFIVDEKEFMLSTLQLKEILGDVALSEPSVVEWISGYLNEQTQIISGGTKDEIN